MTDIATVTPFSQDLAVYIAEVKETLDAKREQVGEQLGTIRTGSQIYGYQDTLAEHLKEAQEKARDDIGGDIYIGGYLGVGPAGAEKRFLTLGNLQNVVDTLRDHRANFSVMMWCWNDKQEEISKWNNKCYQWIASGLDRWAPFWKDPDYVDNLGQFVGGYSKNGQKAIVASGDEETVARTLRTYRDENPKSFLWCRDPEGGDLFKSNWKLYQWIYNGKSWCRPDWYEKV